MSAHISVLMVDAGGVLFNNVMEETPFIDQLATRLGVNPNELATTIDRCDRSYEINERHVHEVIAEAVSSLGGTQIRDMDLSWIDDAYIKCVQPSPSAFEAVRQIRRRRPEIKLVLANNEARHWDELKQAAFGHFDLFDVLGSSWHLGAVKPEQNYFQRLFEVCNGSIEKAMLIDDNDDVLVSAMDYGIVGFRVDTSPWSIDSALALFDVSEPYTLASDLLRVSYK